VSSARARQPEDVAVEGDGGVEALRGDIHEVDTGGECLAPLLTARDPGDVGYIELLPGMGNFGIVVLDDFHVLEDRIRREIAPFRGVGTSSH